MLINNHWLPVAMESPHEWMQLVLSTCVLTQQCAAVLLCGVTPLPLVAAAGMFELFIQTSSADRVLS